MIAVDWGSTRLRAFRLDGAGRVLDHRHSPHGVLGADGRFADILRETLAGWDDSLIVMAGMVGSRQGWFEVAYVDCPAGIDDIARALYRVPPHAFDGRAAWIVPGQHTRNADGVDDAMRGEEAQLCGLLAQAQCTTAQVCLPGTHSKHARILNGRIEHFATAMTGEMFALLCEHSVLGRLMTDGAHDQSAFARGIEHAARPGDLLQHLFAVRTLGLFERLRTDQLRSFLSGLLIGHELNHLAVAGQAVHLVGEAALLDVYQTALNLRGAVAHRHDEWVGARGCHVLAQRAGLLVHPT